MTNTESVAFVAFPAPEGLQINMMPFVIGDHDSLPPFLDGYRSLIDACEVEADEVGKVGYLTVTETPVTEGRSQRRGGIHVERHPATPMHGGRWGSGGGWGSGSYADRRGGGLYMASNMEHTTAVWNAHVEEPGHGGDCEHLAEELGDPTLLEAGELVWMTDACPHASLPAPRSGLRQFFRLVTSAVDLWYVQHSTENPLGVTPPDNVKIITTDKFTSLAR